MKSQTHKNHECHILIQNYRQKNVKESKINTRTQVETQLWHRIRGYTCKPNIIEQGTYSTE